MTSSYKAINSCDDPVDFFVINFFISFAYLWSPAGKATTDEELEEMLESGNAAVFTAGVCVCVCV